MTKGDSGFLILSLGLFSNTVHASSTSRALIQEILLALLCVRDAHGWSLRMISGDR